MSDEEDDLPNLDDDEDDGFGAPQRRAPAKAPNKRPAAKKVPPKPDIYQVRRRQRQTNLEEFPAMAAAAAAAAAPAAAAAAAAAAAPPVVDPTRNADGRPRALSCWMITAWDPNFDPEELRKNTDVKFFAGQLEMAPNAAAGNPQGGRHWQIYVELSDRMSAEQVKKSLKLEKCYIDQRRCADSAKAIAYVTKEETRIEGTVPVIFGTKAGPDAVTGFGEAMQALRDGASLEELAEKHTTHFVRCSTGMMRAAALLNKPNARRDVDVQVFWGEAGTGKTHRAYEEAPDLYSKDCSNTWWDGYFNQKAVLLDDYKGQFNLQYFLRLIDKYPFQLQLKGSCAQLHATKIYITSNTSPDDWYPNASPKEKAAIKRRLPPENVHFFSHTHTTSPVLEAAAAAPPPSPNATFVKLVLDTTDAKTDMTLNELSLLSLQELLD